MEKARQIVERLGMAKFKGSNGWLLEKALQGRYNVKQMANCGESSDVQGETIRSWKERLPELLQGSLKMSISYLALFWEEFFSRIQAITILRLVLSHL